MDLSIIILNYNTCDYLVRLISSINASDFYGIKSEVIVADNGSWDGSQKTLKKKFSNVRLVEINNNFGFSKANNIAARYAKGEYLLFLNSDMEVKNDSIKKLYNFVKKEKVYAGGTAKLVLENGRIDPACHRGFPTPWNAFCYFSGLEKILGKLKPFGGYHALWNPLDKYHEIDCISGACFLIKKSIFDQMHGWDESFFMYGEDIDFCYRLKMKNYKLVYYPLTQITHFKKRSGRQKKENKKSIQEPVDIKKETSRHFYYTMQLFYKKHYQNLYPKLIYHLVLFGIKMISRIKK